MCKSILVFIFFSIFSVNFLCFALNQEKTYCNYEHCLGENFFCATDGKDFQLFRNICYMKYFNYCNQKSELSKKKIN